MERCAFPPQTPVPPTQGRGGRSQNANCCVDWNLACLSSVRQVVSKVPMQNSLTHLKQLEAESIHIFREVAAEFERPVMLYSVGKDSAVMVRPAILIMAA